MTTIREIARLSGSSVTTVSRVINHHPYVSEEKRLKIQAIIDELGYKPNILARNLSFGKSNTLGVMVPYTNQPYFDAILSGIIHQAFQQGMMVSLLPTDYDKEVEKSYLEKMATGAFDGMIVLAKANPLSVFAPYKEQVVFCEKIEDPSYASIYIDRLTVYRRVFQALKQQGCSEVAITINRAPEKSTSARYLVDAYQEIYGAIPENRLFKDCLTYEDGCEVGRHCGQDPTLQAVVTNGDEIAAGIQAVIERPLFLVGQEQTLLSEILNFSTICHPLMELGEKATHLFQEKRPKTIQLTSTFINRQPDFSFS